MKLHLGCGNKYLDGYINIDLPDVNRDKKPDIEKNILDLSYKSCVIDEIRTHVFEHFTRPIACALVLGWNNWLQNDGKLLIEVPDFKRSAKVVLSPFSSKKKKYTALRHLFGSHNDFWAVHCEGYTVDSLRELLSEFGMVVDSVKKNSWHGTYNFSIYCSKKIHVDYKTGAAGAIKYMQNYLVDSSETALLDIWMTLFKEQYDKMVIN